MAPVQSLTGGDTMNQHCTHTEPALHFECIQTCLLTEPLTLA